MTFHFNICKFRAPRMEAMKAMAQDGQHLIALHLMMEVICRPLIQPKMVWVRLLLEYNMILIVNKLILMIFFCQWVGPVLKKAVLLWKQLKRDSVLIRIARNLKKLGLIKRMKLRVETVLSALPRVEPVLCLALESRLRPRIVFYHLEVCPPFLIFKLLNKKLFF